MNLKLLTQLQASNDNNYLYLHKIDIAKIEI